MSSQKQPTEKPTRLYKILVVGDFAVGKTSLINRYCTGEFTSAYKITIGVDFWLKQLQWDKETISLQLWDIAGHERFGTMTKIYYKFAIAALIVFDISRPSTLDNVKKWRDDINDKVMLGDGTPIPMVLLANKCDMPDIHIDKEKMSQFCQENGFCAWFETSAKSNINVEKAFETLVSVILNLSDSAAGSISPVPDTKAGEVRVITDENGNTKTVDYKKTGRSCCKGAAVPEPNAADITQNPEIF